VRLSTDARRFSLAKRMLQLCDEDEASEALLHARSLYAGEAYFRS
jgi:hypothetical protein